MANTNSNKLSFAFSYGFTEGKAHSKSLAKMLVKAGYIPSDDPGGADIVIAHSAGCWYKLDRMNPRILIYVGMPLPTKKASHVWLKANKVSFRAQIKSGRLFRLIKSTVYSLVYLLRHPQRNLEIIHKAEHAMPIKFKKTLTVFIMNQNDPWPHSSRLDQLIKDEKWSFISLNGAHNNLWHQPDKYVKLINHYARLLAKTDQR